MLKFKTSVQMKRQHTGNICVTFLTYLYSNVLKNNWNSNRCKIQLVPFVEYFSMPTQIYKKSGCNEFFLKFFFLGGNECFVTNFSLTNQPSQFPGVAECCIGQEVTNQFYFIVFRAGCEGYRNLIEGDFSIVFSAYEALVCYGKVGYGKIHPLVLYKEAHLILFLSTIFRKCLALRSVLAKEEVSSEVPCFSQHIISCL